jgi:MFS family permease
MLGIVPQAVPQSRRALALYVAAGAVFATIGARGLTVPLYAHDLGASRFEVGALFSVSTIVAAFLCLPAGVLVDRFGVRNLLGLSLVLAAVSQLAMAATPAVTPLFIWSIVGGLAAGIQQSAIFSAVAESVSGARIGRAMGWLTFSMQSGFFLGPALAGLALTWVDVRTDIAITTALLFAAVPGVIVASSTTQRSGTGLSLRAPLRSLMRQTAFWPAAIALVGLTLTWGTFNAFVPIFGKEQLGLPSSQVGYLLALQAIVNAVSRIPGGRIVDHAKRRWPIVFVGALGWCTTCAVLGHLTGFVGPALLLVIGTPFVALSFVAVGVVFADLSNSSTRGVTMGMYGTVLFAGLSIGPLLFGPIVQSYGYAAGFTASAIAAMTLIVVMAAMHAEPIRRRTAPAPLGDSETRPAATRQV